MNNLKHRIQQGETVHGCWINLGSALSTEIVGMAGFDWVLIDLEHGAGSEKDVLAQLQALNNSGTAALVRVESHEPSRISRVMEMGAQGIMCPKVNNAPEAKKVINGLHFPPLGNRGVATMVRAAGFGKSFDEYYKDAKANLLGIVQIETVEALSHLDEIASVDGVDILFIGPGDLTMDMGIFGQFNHPRYIKAVEDIILAASKAGKVVGILFFDTHDYRRYHDMGIRFIGCGSDSVFLGNGAKEMVRKLNEMKR
jgi:4-hydroxy-2-oxoheptanedioate aldolase